MEDRLVEIKARRAKASPSNWRYDTMRVNRTSWPDDQAFIVHAAEDVDWLIGEVERLSHLHGLDHSLADQWQVDNERLRSLLVRLEWAGDTGYGGSPEAMCPACFALRGPEGQEGPHRPACELAKELLREVAE